MLYIPYLYCLIFTEVLLLVLLYFISKQKKGQIKVAFSLFILCLAEWTFCLILQICMQNTSIDPFFFEKLSAFGAFFSPVSFYFLGKIFSQTKIKFKWTYVLPFIIPTCSLLLALTNDYHHLFVESYSIRVGETVWGPYFMIHSVYTFILYFIGILYFLKYSIKNSGFFSKQSILIILGTIVPLVINFLGMFGVPMPVYMQPLSFSATVLFYSLAIFKFQFLRATPIALQKIVDRISDSYIVLNDDDMIIDFNQTFLNTFHKTDLRNTNIFEDIQEDNFLNIEEKTLKEVLQKVRESKQTYRFEKYAASIQKYFIIEINGIVSDKNFLGTLILFKDTTQHMLDMKTIQDKQDMLMEKERLASLGQLIGGIAHNLKTPIMSISGAAEGLHDLITEYDNSIEDPEVTAKDHHDIAKDMSVWVEKIKEYTEYMSDVITAVKGQAVTLSDEQAVSFTVEELVKRVDILMKHELKNALINLKVTLRIEPTTELKGNVNSLVQVINNMISNSIQAYNGQTDKDIYFDITKEENQVIFTIKDEAGGLPKEVEEKLFKEMITTKGKNGTGLGLFMSYSNIRAHFNGNITFETKRGEGTAFHIRIPIAE